MRTLAAILALSPALLNAQTKSPAQPVSTPTLQSSLLAPAAVLGVDSVPAARRVSTGVTPPQLIHSVVLQQSSAYASFYPAQRTVVVQMMVDRSGKPEDLQITTPSDPFTNREVLAAVSQFRYQPATVSGIPVAIPVTLELIIRRND